MNRLPKPIQDKHGVFEDRVHQLSQIIIGKLAKHAAPATQKVAKFPCVQFLLKIHVRGRSSQPLAGRAAGKNSPEISGKSNGLRRFRHEISHQNRRSGGQRSVRIRHEWLRMSGISQWLMLKAKYNLA